MAQVFTEQSLFLNIKLSWNYKQGFSAKLWENCDLTQQSVVNNIFVLGEFLHPDYVTFQTVHRE